MSSAHNDDQESGLLPPGQQRVADEKWPVIGERKPAPVHQPWELNVSGEIDEAIPFSLNDLHQLKQHTAVIDIHCVTRWSKPGVEFTGVLLADLLKSCPPKQDAKFISFVAHSTRKHSTSLPLAEALEHKTLIAHTVNGEPLEPEHGGPLRNIVPGKYFYKSVKWLRQIELLSEDRLGFWEAESGYHNEADPWREQRYMAPQIDRRTAARLIAEKNFAGHDLRSMDAKGRELSHLLAQGAALRDANFNNANLQFANFSHANMSNCHLRNADLRNAIFIGTDLEGANLSGADLRGSDMTGCSLIGSSFCETDAKGRVILGALIDQTTSLQHHALEPLTPTQLDYVLGKIS